MCGNFIWNQKWVAGSCTLQYTRYTNLKLYDRQYIEDLSSAAALDASSQTEMINED